MSTEVADTVEEKCGPLPLQWIAGQKGAGECRLTTQNYSHALSPAFLIDGTFTKSIENLLKFILFILSFFSLDYNWKSGQYSTWTESTWAGLRARMFLRPSRVHEIVTLSIGIVMLIISFCLVYIISSRSEILFEGATTSSDA